MDFIWPVCSSRLHPTGQQVNTHIRPPPCSKPTCLVAGCLLCVHAVGQVRCVAEHPAGGLVVVRGGNRRRLAGCWCRWRCPKCCPIPAGPGARKLAREVDSESAETTVGVSVVVERVTAGPPARLLLDERVWPQGSVGCSQGGIRGGGGMEVQDRSPLRGRADG